MGGVPSANYEYARFVKAVAALDPVVIARPRQKRDHDKKKTVVDKFHETEMQKSEKFKARARATRSYTLQNLFLSGYKNSVNELRKAAWRSATMVMYDLKFLKYYYYYYD